MNRLPAYALLLIAALTGTAAAQQDNGGGFLADLLEESFSGENRYVQVTGLEGALSGRATIEKLTIADDAGIWLSLRGVLLDWNRLALARRVFSVNALSAEEIIVARRPGAIADGLPAPESRPFALPQLPLAIDIARIGAERVVLGAPVLGLDAELALEGRAALANGTLDTALSVTRLDRPGDGLTLSAGFDGEGRRITLDLRLREQPGGLVSAALGIPDRPALELSATGAGPVGDFTADIALTSGGQDRLAGRVRLRGETGRIAFDAGLAGDVTPLLASDYRAFFGPDTRLELNGRRDADGGLEIARFDIASEALNFGGALDLAASGGLERLEASGRITPPGGGAVLLPLSGPRSTIRSADLSLRAEAAADGVWELALTLDGLSRPDLEVRRAEIRGTGRLGAAPDTPLSGRVSARLGGILPSDPDLAAALGAELTLDGAFTRGGNGALQLDTVSLRGADYTAAIDGRIDGLASGFRAAGRARIEADDIARFSGLAGRPLGGSLRARIEGAGAPLGGDFDIVLEAEASDLRGGIARLDPLLAGISRLVLDARRGTDGITIRRFRLSGNALEARAEGVLRSTGSDLRVDAALDDLARLLPQVAGPARLSGAARQQGRVWSGTLRAEGPGASFAELSGSVTPDGTADLVFDAALARIERFVPELAGTLRAQGTAARSGTLWRIAADTAGPAGIEAQIAGTIDEIGPRADITARGQLRPGVLNPLIAPNSVQGKAAFDLALAGRPEPGALSGTITVSDMQVALPELAQTITALGGTATLAQGRAELALRGEFRAGGQFTLGGPVALRPPFAAELDAGLQQIVLSDQRSYRTRADGRLNYRGPLAGNGTLSGDIAFGETEINIAAAGIAAGAAPIPPLTHRDEPAGVRATRDRAGLNTVTEPGRTGPRIDLDVVLRAPNRVFVRGRGLQAEMGGTIRLGGDTENVVPTGQIGLIRGRLDILGRRLDLSRGLVSLQGRLEPYVEFAATSATREGVATLELTGPLSAPRIEVFSEPERPSEEALAMLVFGDRFSELSPLRLARLAASLARLGGGEGASGRIRERLGIDALDLGADAEGNARLGFGTYLSENVYTDLSVNSRGETELNLNLDVSDALTLRGSTGAAGDAGLGLFYERDY